MFMTAIISGEPRAASIFALPIPLRHESSTRVSAARKRKRAGQHDTERGGTTLNDGSTEEDNMPDMSATEYSAVVTPAERSQRRLAGQSIDQEPPSLPFPHKARNEDEDQVSTHRQDAAGRLPQANDPSSGTLSLRLQHMAAMTAILHRSVMEGNYTRASKALGMLLRSDLKRQSVDIRSQGRWGVGAEILMWRNAASTSRLPLQGISGTDQHSRPSALTTGSSVLSTRHGWEDVKRYYDALIVQYPFHKLHPDAINALDFNIAMLGLWVYIIHEESLQQQRSSGPDEEMLSYDEDSYIDSTEYKAKTTELEQAKEVSATMDTLMATLPYSDDLELIRLRAMVALWTADLEDFCSFFEKFKTGSPYKDTDDTGITDNEASSYDEKDVDLTSKASRGLADRFFARLAADDSPTE